MFRPALAAALLTLCAAPAISQPVHYVCSIRNPPTGSAMKAGIEIFYNPELKQAYAYDSAIYLRYREPMMVKIDVDNPRRTTFSWTVRKIPGRLNGRPTILPGVIETATVLKGSLALTFYTRPLVYEGSYGMNGHCTAKPMKWPE